MLRIYGVALKMLEAMRPAIEEIEKKDRDLARQMRRAGSSVVLNIAEGMGSSGGTRRERYRNALGSVRELRGGLDVGRVLGYIGPVVIEEMREVTGSLVRLSR